MEDAIAIMSNLILLLGVRVHQTDCLTPAMLDTLRRARRDLDDVIDEMSRRLDRKARPLSFDRQPRETTAGTVQVHLN